MSEYLETLNEAQKEAVLDREHNLLILACAGSGKTRTITSKIAYYIESGFLKPYEILAVTFTNKAAAEMRGRLESMLSGYDITGMEIRTFHSFGAWLLRRHGEKVGLSSSFSIYDDADSMALLSQIAAEVDKKEIRALHNAISRAKDHGVRPDSSEVSKFSSGIEDFSLYYNMYERALSATGNCDFADLILKPVILLNRFSDIREKYQRRFKLILVDEYQDSNRMQFELLSLISSKNSQLCVVGDDDQSIYSFRGADIENILTFNRSFKNVKAIKLEKNYRSTSEILSIAASVIKNNKARHKKEIISFDGHHGKKPELLTSFDGRTEAEDIVRKIKRIDDYDNTAIIYRTNAQSLEFERELQANRIPYRLVGALKFYEREEVKDSLAILRLLVNPYDSVNFRRIINKPTRGLGEKTVDKILEKGEGINTIEALREFAKEAPSKARSGANEFIDAYEKATYDLSQNLNLGEVLSNALHYFRLDSYYASEMDENVKASKQENLSAFGNTLSEYGEGRAMLESFLENITLDNTTAGGSGKDDRIGVTLITMHNTKGLEFDYVFVSGLEDELIPGQRSSATEKGIEEERRLFYVAVTRARKELYLTYTYMRAMWGRRESRHPSRYLNEIPNELYSGKLEQSRNNPFDYVGASVSQKKRTEVSNTPSWAKNIKITPPKAPEKKEIPLFELYDRVKSPTYGEGDIINIKSGEIGKRLLTIRFKLLGEVKLNESTANLTILSKGNEAPKEKVKSKFSVGDRVSSEAHGKGEIKEIKEINGKRVLSILFDSGKTIKIMEGYSSLEKIV